MKELVRCAGKAFKMRVAFATKESQAKIINNFGIRISRNISNENDKGKLAFSHEQAKVMVHCSFLHVFSLYKKPGVDATDMGCLLEKITNPLQSPLGHSFFGRSQENAPKSLALQNFQQSIFCKLLQD